MKVNPIGPNQTELTLNEGNTLVLFSYQTPVAAFVDGKAYRTEKKWSATTSKHINRWLDGEDAEEKPQAFFDALK
jgi:hypothetical protein